MEFDYIVVGAGSAGCVVAARLSENPNRRVLLIEAGQDIDPEPASIRNPYPVSHGVREFRWPGMTATIKAPRQGMPAPGPVLFAQARVFGGGGSLMGMFALRGLPRDFDDWQAQGANGWGWKDVLPAFRRLETDLDFGGEMHGRDGPVSVRRIPQNEWSPFARAVGDSFEADGHPFVVDPNADFRNGHISMPSSRLPDRRISSANAYLDRRTRARPNLTILSGAEVRSVCMDGRRATGVFVAVGNETLTYGARRIVICAGALKSPEILMRSGIGPAAMLKEVGIDPVHDLPGVGRNLSNHPVVYLAAFIPRRYRLRESPAIFSGLRYSSGLPDCPEQDMFLPLINRTAWHRLGDCVSLLGASVYKPASRGSLTLVRDGDIATSRIDLAFFADDRDFVRMTEGLKLVHRHIRAAERALPGLQVFAPTDMSMMTRLATPDAKNALIAWLATAVLDGPAPVRRRAIAQVGLDPAVLMANDKMLADYVYCATSPMFHPASTCRLGSPSDPGAVVAPDCSVIGVDGLYVADASVMPSIVRGNTNIPTIMIGERAADMLAKSETLRRTVQVS